MHITTRRRMDYKPVMRMEIEEFGLSTIHSTTRESLERYLDRHFEETMATEHLQSTGAWPKTSQMALRRRDWDATESPRGGAQAPWPDEEEDWDRLQSRGSAAQSAELLQIQRERAALEKERTELCQKEHNLVAIEAREHAMAADLQQAQPFKRFRAPNPATQMPSTSSEENPCPHRHVDIYYGNSFRLAELLGTLSVLWRARSYSCHLPQEV
uniref:Uncharacterized protein n=1 Tax=Sphaerodactylus townsendi TaxID=933632 RepID=A0ACB8FL72_9SAUR